MIKYYFDCKQCGKVVERERNSTNVLCFDCKTEKGRKRGRINYNKYRKKNA